MNSTLAAVPETNVTVILREPQMGDGVTYPKKGDNLTCHYTGAFANESLSHPPLVESIGEEEKDTLAGMKVFDCSRTKGRPIRFTLGSMPPEVIQGWEEGIPRLSLGDRAVLYVPAAAAYGARGYPPDENSNAQDIPPNTNLVFDVELLAINGAKSEAYLRMKENTILSPEERQAVDDSFLEGLNLEPNGGNSNKKKKGKSEKTIKGKKRR